MYYKRDKEKGWCLEEVKKMAAPILAMMYIDMRCDGIKDLIVLSMRGVHVLQVLEIELLYILIINSPFYDMC